MSDTINRVKVVAEILSQVNKTLETDENLTSQQVQKLIGMRNEAIAYLQQYKL